MPADLQACFSRLVPAPTQKALTKADTFRLIGALRRSELEKAGCGERALAFYETIARELAAQ